MDKTGPHTALRILVGFIFVAVFCPARANAGFRRTFSYGPGYHSEFWHHGYWHHGSYVGRPGWWWIVGPSWYFYAEPVYPYPTMEVRPMYFVELPRVLPPATPPLQVPAAASPTVGKAFSYYCEKAGSYYPVVINCPDGWKAFPVAAPN